MHRHLVRLAARPAPPRPAKVVQLEARRQARVALAQEHLKRLPPRPAA
jgi:hypothetical protein